MTNIYLSLLLLALPAAAPGFSQNDPLAKLHEEMNLGVQAYQSGQYAAAVQHFKTVLMLDPSDKDAEFQLATSYMIQWVPGANSPENVQNHDLAVEHFKAVLDKDSRNSLALAMLASMAYNAAETVSADAKEPALDEAKKWNERRMAADPNNAESYYYLGVISWSKSFAPIQTAKAAANMPATATGPLADVAVRATLNEKYATTIEEGLDSLNKCLAIDGENDDAMNYMGLLLRNKALLEDAPSTAEADVTQADMWMNKALDTKKTKAARIPASSQE